MWSGEFSSFPLLQREFHFSFKEIISSKRKINSEKEVRIVEENGNEKRNNGTFGSRETAGKRILGITVTYEN
jgi:hypothetical protein